RAAPGRPDQRRVPVGGRRRPRRRRPRAPVGPAGASTVDGGGPVVRGPLAPLTLLRGAAIACLLLVALAVGLPPNLAGAWSRGARAPVFPGLAWAAFGPGAVVVSRLPTRTAVVLIVAGGLLLPAVAVLSPPRSSDDVYRYGWDARVQLAGI